MMMMHNAVERERSVWLSSTAASLILAGSSSASSFAAASRPNFFSKRAGVGTGAAEETELLRLIQSYDWAGVLTRIESFPHECQRVDQDGKTPLHLCCEEDAPAVVIQSLLKVYPEASIQLNPSAMTPLHVTCSSSHASVHVIRVLLELGRSAQCEMRDMDGDTPLHAACRCGASMEVLEVLLTANPAVVHERDLEGLTPLLRLWVRSFVILGDDAIERVHDVGDLTGELGAAWQKTELLLKCAYLGSLASRSNNKHTINEQERPFRVVHAASSVDCPRAVVRIATKLYPRQLEMTDEEGRTPLMLAAMTPIFKVRDLSDEGYTLEDVIHGDTESETSSDGENSRQDDEQQEQQHEPQHSDGMEGSSNMNSSHQASVIDVLLQADQELAGSAANVPDKGGLLPLHVALICRKRLFEGVQSIIDNYPDALVIPHPASELYPFMLAAQGGDIDTTFDLLRQNPSAVSEAFRKKNFLTTATTSPSSAVTSKDTQASCLLTVSRLTLDASKHEEETKSV